MHRAILLTGTVGAGKSTTGGALSDLLWERGTPHALVDLDAVSILRPPPRDDGFNVRVMLRNVRDLAANYAAAGAEVLILAGVIETAAELRGLTDAVGAPVAAVRLVGDRRTTLARLHDRHRGEEARLRWHLGRTVELDRVLDAWTDPVRVDTSGLAARAVAERVLEAVAG